MADLLENADGILSVTDVNFSAAAQTTLYTVPVGKTLVITKVIIVVGGDAAETDITIGVTATWDNWAGANGIAGGDIALDNLDAAKDMIEISPATFVATPAANNVLQRYIAGEVIKIDVTAGNGNASNDVYLYGTLRDA